MVDSFSQNSGIYFKTIINSVRDLIVILSTQYTIEDASLSFYRKFDLERDDVKDKSIFDINKGQWDVPQMRKFLEEAASADNSVEASIHIDFEALGRRDFILSAQPFNCDDDGHTLMLMVVINDVTEANIMEHRMARYTEDLQQRNIELDIFARTVAHDLKNPISSMVGFASLVKAYFDRMAKDDILEHIEEIIQSGYHIQRIIDALLLLATLDREEQITPAMLDTPRLIENVYRNLDNLIREYRVQIDLPDEWPVAYGYAPWIETLWTNFISNAIKYGGSPPHVVLGAEQLADGRVHFWVQDNGKGLTEAQREQVFKPFERIQDVNHPIEGHGLGLTIVLKILLKIRGEVSVKSEVGEGSIFGFILPAPETD